MSAVKLLLVNVVIEFPDRDKDLQTQNSCRQTISVPYKYFTLDALTDVSQQVY